MNTSIEQRAAKNTFAGVIGFIITFLQSILIVPIILSNWGTNKYGNWIALFAGFALLQTMDLGHQNYIANEINVLYHKNKSELKRVLSSSIMIAWIIGFVEVLITLILIVTGELSIFLGLNTAENEIQYAILTLMIMWFVFGSVSGILIRLLVPIGKLYELQWISIIIKLAQFMSLIVVVFFNGSILTAAVAYSIIQSILTILSLVYIKKLAPEFYPWWFGGNVKLALQNFYKSIALTFNTIIQQLSVNGLILFVSNFYQVAQVPVFTTVRTLTNTAGSVTNILSSAVSPDIVKYYSKGEDRKLFLSLSTNLFLSGLIVNIALVLSLFFIEPLYKLWTHGQLKFNLNLFLFLAAGISFSNFGIGIVNYFFSVNKLRQYTYIILSKSLSLFTIAYLLLWKDDLSTIGISVAFAEFISSVILPVYFMNRESSSFFQSYVTKFFILSLISPLLIFCLGLLAYFQHLNMYLIMIVLIITLTVYYINWGMIEPEVKKRLFGLIKKYLNLDRTK